MSTTPVMFVYKQTIEH